MSLRAKDDRPVWEGEVEVDREADLVLPGWGEIRGRVVDADSGEPVRPFTIRLQGGWLETSRAFPGESFDDREGRFVLRKLLRETDYTVLVDAPGYGQAERKGLRAGAPGAGEEAVVEVHAGKPLEGTVVDAAAGTPLGGVTVYCASAEHARWLFPRADPGPFRGSMPDLRTVVTATDGAFRFIDDGKASLFVRAPGRRRLLVPAERRAQYAAPGGALRIPLEAGELLSGTCRIDGRPAKGVDVRADRLPAGAGSGASAEPYEHAETDAEGRFRFDDLAPGPWLLVVERSGGAEGGKYEMTIRRRVALEAGEEPEVEIGGGEPAALRGRITGMEGRPSVWASLRLVPRDPPDGDEVVFKTYQEWGWRLSGPRIARGTYEASVEVWEKGGNRTWKLPPVAVPGDGEQEIAVPAGR